MCGWRVAITMGLFVGMGLYVEQFFYCTLCDC